MNISTESFISEVNNLVDSVSKITAFPTQIQSDSSLESNLSDSSVAMNSGIISKDLQGSEFAEEFSDEFVECEEFVEEFIEEHTEEFAEEFIEEHTDFVKESANFTLPKGFILIDSLHCLNENSNRTFRIIQNPNNQISLIPEYDTSLNIRVVKSEEDESPQTILDEIKAYLRESNLPHRGGSFSELWNDAYKTNVVESEEAALQNFLLLFYNIVLQDKDTAKAILMLNSLDALHKLAIWRRVLSVYDVLYFTKVYTQIPQYVDLFMQKSTSSELSELIASKLLELNGKGTLELSNAQTIDKVLIDSGVFSKIMLDKTSLPDLIRNYKLFDKFDFEDKKITSKIETILELYENESISKVDANVLIWHAAQHHLDNIELSALNKYKSYNQFWIQAFCDKLSIITYVPDECSDELFVISRTGNVTKTSIYFMACNFDVLCESAIANPKFELSVNENRTIYNYDRLIDVESSYTNLDCSVVSYFKHNQNSYPDFEKIQYWNFYKCQDVIENLKEQDVNLGKTGYYRYDRILRCITQSKELLIPQLLNSESYSVVIGLLYGTFKKDYYTWFQSLLLSTFRKVLGSKISIKQNGKLTQTSIARVYGRGIPRPLEEQDLQQLCGVFDWLCSFIQKQFANNPDRSPATLQIIGNELILKI